MLKKVKLHNIQPQPNPEFLQPNVVHYSREGQDSLWEIIKSHDTVHILIDNIDTQELVFVKQVRIPVLVNNPRTDGAVVECCAGIIDKYPELATHHPKERALQIAQEEIREELGYAVELDDIVPIKQLKSSVGMSGTTAHLFYATVEESDYIGQQLSMFEDIEVVKVPYANVEEFINDATTDATTMFLTCQWLKSKVTVYP